MGFVARRRTRATEEEPESHVEPTTEVDAIMLELERRDLVEFFECRLSCGVLLEEVINVHVRWPHVTRVRRAIWADLMSELGWPSKAVGRLFRCDHSSVLAGIKLHAALKKAVM